MLILVLAALLLVGCVPRFLASDPDPRLTLDDVRIDNHRVTVVGSTDLPDGTIIDLQTVQWDLYLKELGIEDPNGRPHLVLGNAPHGPRQSVPVQHGEFGATFDIGGWPAGDGAVIADFVVLTGQPRSVVDRYGLDGEHLKGPDVITDSDGGRYVEINHSITIPEP